MGLSLAASWSIATTTRETMKKIPKAINPRSIRSGLSEPPEAVIVATAPPTRARTKENHSGPLMDCRNPAFCWAGAAGWAADVSDRPADAVPAGFPVACSGARPGRASPGRGVSGC
ncbi:hypothetical protein ACFFX0_15630 [Citricoccus parietis]|uniref:Uncharacterized protein n=1 Tax=Citricoccus parietis TaxID=592307 RepID=A0ABV5G0U4_9MICC